MEHRTCFDSLGRGCGRTLPVDDFAKKGKHKDGSQRYHALCKPCFAGVYREWCEANPSTRSATRRRSYTKHAAERREKAKQRDRRALEHRRALHREWWEVNRDEQNARRRALYRAQRAGAS